MQLALTLKEMNEVESRTDEARPVERLVGRPASDRLRREQREMTWMAAINEGSDAAWRAWPDYPDNPHMPGTTEYDGFSYGAKHGNAWRQDHYDHGIAVHG